MSPRFALAALLFAALPAGATPCPNIMFVLDQSGSMGDDPMGNVPNPPQDPSKWQLLQMAVTTIVNAYVNQVPFGMEMFTSSAFDDATCYSDTKINVEPAHNTAMSIIQMVTAAMPSSGTNTGEAIKRAAVDPAMHDQARGEYIILITDGDPNCNSGEGTNAAYTVSQIKAAAGQGPSVHTFVVGFDGMAAGGVNPANLNAMANAGLEPQSGCAGTSASPCYYSASNATKLNMALDKIINQITGGGEFGMAMCDDSCYANGCPPASDGTTQICVTDETSTMPHCVPDPCYGVTNCAPAGYCRQGQCVMPCPACKMGEVCVSGTCLADPCAGIVCPDGAVCSQQTGQCIVNPCVGKTCKAPTVCDPMSGNCVDDQCHIVTCPAGTTCVSPTGDCETNGGGDGGAGGGKGRGRGGCSLGSRAVSPLSALVALLALAALGRSLRRRS
jgi:hypothetical protein